MNYTLFLDTNALLNLQDAAFNENFIISQKTLEEIENIKSSGLKDNEIKYKARKIAHLLDENYGKYTVIRYDTETRNILQDFFLIVIHYLFSLMYLLHTFHLILI